MSGWRISGGPGAVRAEAVVRVDHAAGTVTVEMGPTKRVFGMVRSGDGWVLSEGTTRTRVVAVAGERETEVVVDGRRRVVAVAAPGAKAPPPIVTPPMPAVVSRLLVDDGAEVKEGQGLVTVTAMKMELTLRAPRAGMARVRVAVGDRVMPGDVLVDVIVATDGSRP